VSSDRPITLDDVDWTDDLLVTYQGEPVTGEVVELDHKGRTVEVATYSAGIQDGLTRRFHPNGQVASEMWFEAGVQEGTARAWHDSGQLRWEGRFRGGRIVAERAWTEDGQPVEMPTNKDRP
jgi:antitoxin component YwqK of YwqJK toxin-antitoxin module